MKLNLLLIILVICIFAIPAKAQVAPDTLSKLNDGFDRLTDLSKQVVAEEDTDLKPLKAEKKTIDDTTDQLAAEVASFKKDVVNYNVKAEAHDKAFSAHNAKKPDIHCKPCTDEYDLEAADLDTEAKFLRDEYDTDKAHNEDLKLRVNKLATDEDKYDADFDKADAAHTVLILKAEAAIKDLQPAATIYGACMAKYPTDDDAALKLDCGPLAIDHVRDNITTLITFKPKSR